MQKVGPRNDRVFVEYVEQKTGKPYDDGIVTGIWAGSSPPPRYTAEPCEDGTCVCGKQHLKKYYLWMFGGEEVVLGRCCHDKVRKRIACETAGWYEGTRRWGIVTMSRALRLSPFYTPSRCNFIMKVMTKLAKQGSAIDLTEGEYKYACDIGPFPKMIFDKRLNALVVINSAGKHVKARPWIFSKRYIERFPYHNRLEIGMVLNEVNAMLECYEKTHPGFSEQRDIKNKSWKSGDNEENKVIRPQVQLKFTDEDIPYGT